MIESGGVMGQPEDLIRRSDAIRIIDELLEQMTEDGCLTVIGDERVKELKEDLEELPTVQPGSRWIPCSKKLPGYTVDVLAIRLSDGTVDLAYKLYSDDCDGAWVNTSNELLDTHDVIAWMPFPDPYEGGKE